MHRSIHFQLAGSCPRDSNAAFPLMVLVGFPPHGGWTSWGCSFSAEHGCFPFFLGWIEQGRAACLLFRSINRALVSMP